jgi:hypothetical protein
MVEIEEISSREYKVMLDQRMFNDRKAAAANLWREVQGSADRWIFSRPCNGSIGVGPKE